MVDEHISYAASCNSRGDQCRTRIVFIWSIWLWIKRIITAQMCPQILERRMTFIQWNHSCQQPQNRVNQINHTYQRVMTQINSWSLHLQNHQICFQPVQLVIRTHLHHEGQWDPLEEYLQCDIHPPCILRNCCCILLIWLNLELFSLTTHHVIITDYSKRATRRVRAGPLKSNRSVLQICWFSHPLLMFCRVACSQAVWKRFNQQTNGPRPQNKYHQPAIP